LTLVELQLGTAYLDGARRIGPLRLVANTGFVLNSLE